jgi:hypothetical protein
LKWVTRENAHVERVSIPWLILRFIDKDAEFSFVPARTDPATVDGIPFDMPGVKLGHHDGKCSFEAFLEEYQLTDDPALRLMGEIIHGADIPMDADLSSESWGVRAIALGFMHKYGLADHDKINAQLEMYDALYLYCQLKTRSDGGYMAIP